MPGFKVNPMGKTTSQVNTSTMNSTQIALSNQDKQNSKSNVIFGDSGGKLHGLGSKTVNAPGVTKKKFIFNN